MANNLGRDIESGTIVVLQEWVLKPREIDMTTGMENCPEWGRLIYKPYDPETKMITIMPKLQVYSEQPPETERWMIAESCSGMRHNTMGGKIGGKWFTAPEWECISRGEHIDRKATLELWEQLEDMGFWAAW